MSRTLKPFIAKVAGGEALTRAEAEDAFRVMMSGEATPSQIGGFLMGLRVRGETVDEIAGAVAVMRAAMLRVEAPDGAVDIVGTGGDHSGTLNVSTCAAFVIAGAGVTVAKHGNRALSSRSGSADVLAALGVKVDLSPQQISAAIAAAGVGFMFAPSHHAAMRFVGPSRVELGTRTVFNLLGPLANPAGVGRLLVGVFSPDWLMPLAETLKALGTPRAWIVHGDGLDEMTVCGRTDVVTLEDGVIDRFSIEPEDVGLRRAPLSEIKGGDAHHNAAAMRGVLDGVGAGDEVASGYRDIVLLNAAGTLVMAGHAGDIREGIAVAADSIASGRAKAALDALVRVTNSFEGAPA